MLVNHNHMGYSGILSPETFVDTPALAHTVPAVSHLPHTHDIEYSPVPIAAYTSHSDFYPAVYFPPKESSLAFTYYQNDLQQMKALLQTGDIDLDFIVVESKNSKGEACLGPLLFSAWRDKKTDMFKLLLENGADPNVYCQDEMTNEISRPLLMEAYWEEDHETVELLLEYGADQEAFEYVHDNSTGCSFASLQQPENFSVSYHALSLEDKESLLTSAYYRDDLQQMEALLQTGGICLDLIPMESINAKGEACFGPLLVAACREGKTKVADLLIQYGADLNAHNTQGESALLLTYHHTVDQEKRYERMKFLLEKGADPNISDPEHEWQKLLVSAWRDNNIAIFKLLLQYKADPDVYDSNDMPHLSRPLLMAAHLANDTTIVELLLKHGASKEACEYYEDESTGHSFSSLEQIK